MELIITFIVLIVVCLIIIFFRIKNGYYEYDTHIFDITTIVLAALFTLGIGICIVCIDNNNDEFKKWVRERERLESVIIGFNEPSITEQAYILLRLDENNEVLLSNHEYLSNKFTDDFANKYFGYFEPIDAAEYGLLQRNEKEKIKSN